jgi:hypothetical protein
MKKLGFVLVAVALLFSVQAAYADFSAGGSCSQLTAIPGGATYPAGSTGGGGLIGGEVTFTLATDTKASFTIVDVALVGDVYEFFVDGKSLGLTSEVEIGGSTRSYGTFLTECLAAGDHTYDLWDITLSYLGLESPFGGGIVPADYSPAGLSIFEVDVACAPIPAALPLFASGLLALGILRRRQR